MPKFRKKPVVIEAVQLPAIGDDVTDEVSRFLDVAASDGHTIISDRDGGVIVQTLEGELRGDPLDWLIRGVKREVYPCKPDIFEATYDPEPDGDA